MFFLMELECEVSVAPRYFGNRLTERIVQQLVKNVEGRRWAKRGMEGILLAVTHVDTIGEGDLPSLDGSGNAVFRVVFTALMQKMFRGEIVEALVDKVAKMGLICEAQGREHGQNGRLRVFVSAHNIPRYLRYVDLDGLHCFTDGGGTRIGRGDYIRARVLGSTVETLECNYACIASIEGNFLGYIDPPNECAAV